MLNPDRIRAAIAALGGARPQASALPTAPAASAASAASAAPTAPAGTAEPAVEKEDRAALEKILGGRWVETEHGAAFVKDTAFPLAHEHGSLPLGAALELAAEHHGCVLGDPGAPPAGRLGFFDTETTGLSGGTGTYVFLAGLGTFDGESFRLRQYFLPSLEGEKAMLALVAADLGRLDGLVTYNGRAFDLPLLETRSTLARLATPFRELPHFDLLRPVRRLYRDRLPSCRLVEAESKVVGFERQGDVPGHAIPSIYFDYIRAGRVSPLRPVLRHNALDILSLVGVLGSLGRLFAREQHAADDAVALARWWEIEDESERAEELYTRALPELEGKDGAAWSQAATRYAALLRRRAGRSSAVELWRRLWENGSCEAGVELAKYLEHDARDLDAAQELVAALLETAPEEMREELERRQARIERKRTGRRRDGSARA